MGTIAKPNNRLVDSHGLACWCGKTSWGWGICGSCTACGTPTDKSTLSCALVDRTGRGEAGPDKDFKSAASTLADSSAHGRGALRAGSELGGKAVPNEGYLPGAVVPLGSSEDALGGEEWDDGKDGGAEAGEAGSPAAEGDDAGVPAAGGDGDRAAAAAAVAADALAAASLQASDGGGTAATAATAEATVAPPTVACVAPGPEEMDALLETSLLQV
eukprot:366185-Chlamydomonas_euryale.AAC.6